MHPNQLKPLFWGIQVSLKQLKISFVCTRRIPFLILNFGAKRCVFRTGEHGTTASWITKFRLETSEMNVLSPFPGACSFCVPKFRWSRFWGSLGCAAVRSASRRQHCAHKTKPQENTREPGKTPELCKLGNSGMKKNRLLQ